MKKQDGNNRTERTAAQNEFWECPKCGNTFIAQNMWHSCGEYALEDLFTRAEPGVLEIYRKLEGLVRSVGEVRVIPQKTRITFKAKVRFLSVYVRKNHLLAGFWFDRKQDDSRFNRIEKISENSYGHEIVVDSAEVFDDAFKGWIRECYEIGLHRQS